MNFLEIAIKVFATFLLLAVLAFLGADLWSYFAYGGLYGSIKSIFVLGLIFLLVAVLIVSVLYMIWRK